MLVIIAFSSIDWGVLLFATLGNWVSFLGYYTLKKDELIMYHNLGLDTWRLLRYSALFMLVAAFPIGFILLGLKAFLWPY